MILFRHEFYILYIILVLILLRADLAIGYDLAPLASSAVGAFKSLALIKAEKLISGGFGTFLKHTTPL